MNRTRWTIVPIALVSLLNLPAAFSPDGTNGPNGSGLVGTALGVVGVVAIVALLRHRPWSRSVALAVGLLNAAGGVWVLAAGYGNGAVGLALGAIITVLAASIPATAGRLMPEAHS
jgi:hypothetical protein